MKLHRCRAPLPHGLPRNIDYNANYKERWRCRLGAHYPTRLHSRDAAYPNFGSDSEDDGSVLCGALVSGPYAPANISVDGPVPGARPRWYPYLGPVR